MTGIITLCFTLLVGSRQPALIHCAWQSRDMCPGHPSKPRSVPDIDVRGMGGYENIRWNKGYVALFDIPGSVFTNELNLGFYFAFAEQRGVLLFNVGIFHMYYISISRLKVCLLVSNNVHFYILIPWGWPIKYCPFLPSWARCWLVLPLHTYPKLSFITATGFV